MLSLHLPGDDVCHPVASGCSCSLHLRVQGIKADDSVVLNDETGLVDWLNTSSAERYTPLSPVTYCGWHTFSFWVRPRHFLAVVMMIFIVADIYKTL